MNTGDVTDINELFRFALHATSATAVDVHTTATTEQGTLVQGILYTRRFVISYNIVLATVLLAVAAWHWSSRFAGLVKVRRGAQAIHYEHQTRVVSPTGFYDARGEEGMSPSSASSGSTIRPSDLALESGKQDLEGHETTPLLIRSSSYARRRPTKLFSIIRSYLIYQPPDIPFIHKTLPSNATSLLILLFLALNAFYLFFRVPLSIRLIYILADRAGLLFAANLPLLYLSSAKNGPLRPLTGHSYEGLNILHRRAGELLCLLALLHMAGMLVV